MVGYAFKDLEYFFEINVDSDFNYGDGCCEIPLPNSNFEPNLEAKFIKVGENDVSQLVTIVLESNDRGQA